MLNNTKLAMAYRDFRERYIDDIALITEEHLSSNYLIVYYSTIKFNNNTPTKHYDRSTLAP